MRMEEITEPPFLFIVGLMENREENKCEISRNQFKVQTVAHITSEAFSQGLVSVRDRQSIAGL